MGELVRKKDGTGSRRGETLGVVLMILLILVAWCGTAAAVEIPTGNDNIRLRWDNTLRYSGAYRVADQNKKLLANPNADDGDRNFKDGMVGNRLDLFSELDLIYKRQYGFRLSGAGWYDLAYSGRLDNRNTATSNHLEDGQPVAGRLDDEALDLYRGPDGELLDAFVFGSFNMGGMPVSLKLGRHTVYWGESLLLGGAIHGISYGQSPIDISKGLMMPGVQVNELFRPLAQLSLQAQPTRNLTVLGQYFMEWEPYRLPEGGTYLGFADPLQLSGESLIVGPGQRLISGDDSEPDAFDNWGVALRYGPEWLDGTLGLYYRKFSDMQPQLAVQPTAAALPVAVGGALGFTQLTNTGSGTETFAFNPADIPEIAAGRVGRYFQAYGKNIDMAGVSFAKEVLGISLGSELSYRWNMPLASTPVMILPAPLAAATPGAIRFVPTDGQVPGARGETLHGVLNFMGLTGGNSLYDASNWIVEVAWNRLVSVTDNPAVFKGRSGYTSIDAPTKDFFGAGATFTPTWYQVLPGIDMTMPLSYSRGLSGNSAIAGGGNHGSGIWSAGLGLDFFTQYKLDLKYIDFFGKIGDDLTPNGSVTAGLKDRDMVTLTLSTKF